MEAALAVCQYAQEKKEILGKQDKWRRRRENCCLFHCVLERSDGRTTWVDGSLR